MYSLRFLIGFILSTLSIIGFCQPSGNTFYVNQYSDGSSSGNYVGSIRQAIDWANGNLSSGNPPTTPGTNLVINIGTNATNTNPEYIALYLNLPPINLDGQNLKITADTNKFIGFKVHESLNNNVVPGSPSFVSRGFEINTLYSANNKNNSVEIENIFFYHWNLALTHVYATQNNVLPYTQFGFATCITVDDCFQVSIHNCKFTGYSTGIIYNNNVRTMDIHHNLFRNEFSPAMHWFSSSASYGCPYPDYITCVDLQILLTPPDPRYAPSQAITLYGAQFLQSNKPASYSTITYNSIRNVSYPEYGRGITIDPADFFAISNQGATNYMIQNYDVRADVTVDNNEIWGFTDAIYQDWVPPQRTTKDVSYQLKIRNNDLLDIHGTNLTLQAPYDHFIFTNNTMSSNFNANHYYNPKTLQLGGGYQIGNNNYLGLTTGNQFGFNMVHDANPLNRINTPNTFIPADVSAGAHPVITTIGRFGPATTGTYKGVNFKNIEYPGSIVVGVGESVSISNCTLQSSTFDNGFEIPPILFEDNKLLTVNYIEPNSGIPSAKIIDAFINNFQQIEVHYELNGGFYSTSANSPFKVEFFKSNNKTDNDPSLNNKYGDLLNWLYTHTPSGTGPCVATFSPPTAFKFGYGDRLAITVTSQGNSTNPHGTSMVSYFTLSDCPKCLEDFSPEPGKTYVISGWTKIPGLQPPTYNSSKSPTPSFRIEFYSDYESNPKVVLGQPVFLKPSGPMIDGWQKIEGTVQFPLKAQGFKLEVVNDFSSTNLSTFYAGTTLFDDIRFYPVDASMKSYAFDADNKRLMAELDENNYATFYEYDEEGKLIRVKKETEKGIMTIKESRNNKPVR